jgi:cation transport regulator ChaC
MVTLGEVVAVSAPRVWTFFYGSFINLDVLKQVDLSPDRVEVARLSGFDIVIRPLANLLRSEPHCVYGIAATATHAELDRLYAYAREDLGGVYLPEAVVAESSDGSMRAALCYIAPELADEPPADDYIGRIVTAAQKHGFPQWYIERLESFRVPR